MLRLDTPETLMAAALVLLLGPQILARVRILRTYTIPEPVVGGQLVALLVLALRSATRVKVSFDTTIQAPPRLPCRSSRPRSRKPSRWLRMQYLSLFA